MNVAVVYIRMRNRVQVNGNQAVRIKDIARIIGPEDEIRMIEDILLLTVKKEDRSIIVVDLAQVIMAIRKVDPGVEVETFGPSQTIIEIILTKKKMSFLTFALVWFLLFIGGAMTIMNFHVDVSMGEVHQKIFTIITGKVEEKPLLIQIPYSFGLGMGMILFFNHFFKKRFNEEPSPLEVEMFNYQQDLDRYVTMNENKENVRHLDDR
ncbi:stage V sporulation protein AA [Peribacillus sp. SI8-4]|uniref:stage V sporulation protein AA n=1 Tax=Peribacillus sp. SI8-4 TaxID=3048009 RepID=UPI0025561967|nr:stage V sporulation protein AA [Peribacillus sp. SI8-4]